MSAEEIVRGLRDMLPPKVDYAELVGAEGFAHGQHYVWEDPEPYIIGAAADLIESQAAEIAKLLERVAELEGQLAAKEAVNQMYSSTLSLVAAAKDEAIRRMAEAEAQLTASQQETRAAVEESLVEFIVEHDADILLAIETKDRAYLEKVLRQWRRPGRIADEINK